MPPAWSTGTFSKNPNHTKIMLIDSKRLNAASQGFRAIYLAAYDGATPNWSKVAMRTTSTGESESYEFLLGIPQMKEMVGEVTLQNIADSGFTIRNKEFEATVPVKRKVIERDNLNILKPALAEMGHNAAFHPDQLVTKLLSNGFLEKDYTGAAFFAANKKYNPSATGAKALKFTNKTDAPLSADAIDAARASLRKRTDAEGNNLNLGQQFLLVVPPTLEALALKLSKADQIEGTTNTQKGTFEVLVLNGLTSDTAWFVLEVGREIMPLIVQYEVEPEFVASTSPDSDHVLLRKEFIYQVYDRKNAGYGLPQLAYGSTGDAVAE